MGTIKKLFPTVIKSIFYIRPDKPLVRDVFYNHQPLKPATLYPDPILSHLISHLPIHIHKSAKALSYLRTVIRKTNENQL